LRKTGTKFGLVGELTDKWTEFHEEELDLVTLSLDLDPPIFLSACRVPANFHRLKKYVRKFG
jgi:hypothetical protein